MELRIVWPRCASFLFNTYLGYSMIMFRHFNEEILSQERTSQGYPLSMLMYAVGVLRLIKSLKCDDWTQVWHADDSICIGKIEEM